jgi:hypothetical protein
MEGELCRKILYDCFKANDIRRLKKPQISEAFPQRTKIFRSKLQREGGQVWSRDVVPGGTLNCR